MRRRAGAVGVMVAASFAAGCLIPDRDNENDPAVRPQAEFEIRIAGNPAVVGSRSSEWELDCGESRDPNGSIERCSWRISNGPGDDIEPGDIAWTALGEGEVLEASTTTAFADALRAVVDFRRPENPDAPMDGTGIVRRWIELTVEDDDGIEDVAVRPIQLTNVAPSLSLGGNRRIMAGGMPGTGEPEDATPFRLRIELFVSDPDGDALSTVEWRVSGDLAPRLDPDGNGIVDSVLGCPAPCAGALEFDAPILPARGTISVRSDDGAASATTSIEVEVSSSTWIYEGGLGLFRRIHPPGMKRDGFGLRVLASDGSHLLRRMDAPFSPATYEETDRLGQTVFRVWPDVHAGIDDSWDDQFEPQATSDGLGGWFTHGVVDPVGEFDPPTHGSACHLATSGTAVCASDPDGDSVEDFDVVDAPIATAGPGQAWFVAGEQPAGRSRIYLMNRDLDVLLDIAAAPTGTHVTGIAATSGATVWAYIEDPADGGTDLLRRFDGTDGSLIAEHAVPTACTTDVSLQALTVAPRTGTVWATFDRIDVLAVDVPAMLCGLKSDGNWLIGSVPPYGASEAMPSADGSEVLLLRGEDQLPIRLLTYDAETLELVRLRTIPEVSDFRGGGHFARIGDRGAASVIRQGGAIANFIYVDGEADFIDATFLAPVGPSAFDGVRHAVDPVNGTVFVWNPVTASIDSHSPDGVWIRSDAVSQPPSGTGLVDGFLAIDAFARTLWVAWTTASGGWLERWELGPSADDAPAIEGVLELESLTKVRVLRAGEGRATRILALGRRAGTTEQAFVWDDGQSQALELVVDPSAGILASAPDGATAWILPAVDFNELTIPVGTSSHFLDASSTLSSVPATECRLRDAVVAPWNGRIYVTATSNDSPFGDCGDGWLVGLDPLGGTTALTPAPASDTLTVAPERKYSLGEMNVDPVYRQIVILVGPTAALTQGSDLLRFYEHSEMSNLGSLLKPQLPPQ